MARGSKGEVVRRTGFIFFALLLTVLAYAAASSIGAWSHVDAATRLPEDERLHPQLEALAHQMATKGRVEQNERAASAAPVQGSYVPVAATARGAGSKLLSDLTKLGMVDGVASTRAVTGRMPLSALGASAGLPTLRYMLPDWMVTNTGSVTSQGDAAFHADDARTLFGVDGTGVKVGVMSDSYDCLHGAAADKASGDLPATVTILKEGPCPFGADEGRAMMQIIHDVAPGAELLFYTAFRTDFGYAKGIHALADAGATVIVDDVGSLFEPFFQDGAIAQAVDEVAAQGVAYFSAAANMGHDAYDSAFRDGGSASPGTFHDFDPGAAVDTTQRVTVAPHDDALFILQWDDPSLLVPGDTQSPQTDLDFRALTTTGNPITESALPNIEAGIPIEIMDVPNNSANPKSVDLQIIKTAGASPKHMKWVAISHGLGIAEFDTASATSFGHPNAAGAMAVGAANYGETPEFGQTPPLLESFSSRGGIPVLLSPTGFAETPQVRQTPDFVAPDGGDNTFFGADTDSTNQPNFFGTSAAAPHAAGAAALALDKLSTATPADICNAFATSAVNMGAAGYDSDTGHGLIDVNAALALLTAPNIGGPCGTTLAPPVVSVDDAHAVKEGQTSHLTVHAIPAPASSLDVTVKTSDGTATAGDDYTAKASGPLTIAANATATTVDVATTDDSSKESTETFNLDVSGVPASATLADATGVGTITDNDVATPTPSPTPTSTPAAKTITFSPNPLVAGQSAVIVGSHFTPNASYKVELHSTPITLGTVQANSNGSFTLSTTIPADVTAGSHSIVVVTASGSTTVSSASASVVRPQTSAASPTPVPSGLPGTGAPIGVLVQLAWLVLLIGGALLLWAYDRKPA